MGHIEHFQDESAETQIARLRPVSVHDFSRAVKAQERVALESAIYHFISRRFCGGGG
jgi:hypothetical protein